MKILVLSPLIVKGFAKAITLQIIESFVKASFYHLMNPNPFYERVSTHQKYF